MDFSLSNDQLAFKSMVQSFVTNKWTPFASKWDVEKTLPVNALKEAADLGLAGIYIDDKLLIGTNDYPIVVENIHIEGK